MEKNSIEFLKNYFEVEIVSQEGNEEFYFDKNFFREGKYIVINNKKTIVYIVKPNDNLESICKKYNKTEEEILLKNNINNIFIGQQLLI
ncbi:MAG: LysM peptidoglycan-binding domain-containing protein [Clostridia bacterium]|nr:LysM peptidoglycan-binding domain-containing protein [Clostridia bacterium]